LKVYENVTIGLYAQFTMKMSRETERGEGAFLPLNKEKAPLLKKQKGHILK